MKFVLSIVAMLAMIEPMFGQSSSSTGGSLVSSSSVGAISPSSSSSGPFIPPTKPLTPDQENDLAVLNTALALAHLESSFFACQLSTLWPLYDFCQNASSPIHFSAADFSTLGFNQSVYEAFEQTAFQSIEHVVALTDLIISLTNNASAAVPACTDYNYQRTGSVPPSDNQTLPVFFAGAQALSASSAQIHLGALSSITDPDVLEIVSGLAAVEARHSSYFWQMQGFAPFSVSGFDAPLSMIQAGLVLRSWTLSCPGVSLTTPTTRPYGIALNTANVTTPGHAEGDVYTGPLSAANNLTYTPEQRSNDVLALDYMLFVEKVFQGLLNESNTQFTLTSWTSAGFNESVWALVQVIVANEDAHASVLRSLLVLYDDAALTQDNQCVYNFSSLLVNPGTFVQALAALKQWSVSAYTGVSSSMTDTGLQQLVGEITTVEARHSAILNLIAAGNQNVPLTSVAQSTAFPTAIDPALTPGQAYDQLRALGLIVSCTANLTVPGRAPLVIPGSEEPLPSSSTGGFFNESSSSGAFVNETSSTGAIGNFSSSTGTIGNLTSSTGIGNVSSSTGIISNVSSSTGIIGNVSSSTGIIGNVSSSTGAFLNQSSSSGTFFNQSSTGSFGNSSSTGSFGNFSSSTGAAGNFSSTGSFNQTTGLSSSVQLNVSSSTGIGNTTSSSSGSAPFTGLLSSIRSSSAGSSSAAASSSALPVSSSAGAGSSSTTAQLSSSPIFGSSSSTINPLSSSGAASLTSSPVFPDLSSSSSDFDQLSSSTGDDVDDPGLNGAASLTQSLSMVFALIVAVGVYMI